MFGCRRYIHSGSFLPDLGLSRFATLHRALQVEQDQEYGLGGAIVVSHLPVNEQTGGYVLPHQGISSAPPPPPPALPLQLLAPHALLLLPLSSMTLSYHLKIKMRP